MSYSSSITNLSSSCVSFIKSGFVFLLGFTPSLSLSNLGVSLIKGGFFFLLGLPQQQHSLVIMDTFKGQDNDIIKEFCSKNRCEVVIVPHNLTNKFQPLDLTVNKAGKAFIQNQYNDWFSDQVARQLKSGKDPTDIKVSSKLSDLKPLHTSWIVDF